MILKDYYVYHFYLYWDCWRQIWRLLGYIIHNARQELAEPCQQDDELSNRNFDKKTFYSKVKIMFDYKIIEIPLKRKRLDYTKVCCMNI